MIIFIGLSGANAQQFWSLASDDPVGHQSISDNKGHFVIPIQKGDTILTGRFRNKPIKVKEIGIDDLGQPTINGNPILKFRIPKYM